MISLSRRDQGFTIVELLIVIIIVGVLGVLVFTTYSGIQQKSRNNLRTSDLKSLSGQIEAYYSENGVYPNLTDLNSPSWRAANMKHLESSWLVDPSSKTDCLNVTPNTCLVSSPKPGFYSYQAMQADEVSGCDGKVGSSADQNCAHYVLTATYEGSVNGSVKDVVKSLE
jgi:prepilin-type N-terminal cleavage/methylation domain-containing protein